MNISDFNTSFYYIKQIPACKIANTDNLWREVALIVRKDNLFISWINTSTNLGFEKTHKILLSRIEIKKNLLDKKPNDWGVPDIYEIMAEYHHIYDGSVKLDIKDYKFHDDVNMIKEKIQKLSEYQKYLMIYPSYEFCQNLLESEYLFRVKSDLFYLIKEIENPSEKLKHAYRKLEEIFTLYL